MNLNSLTKWMIFNGTIAFISAYAWYFYDAFNYLLSVDPSRITLGIFAAYSGISLFLGYKLATRKEINLTPIQFIGNSFMAWGLIGTLIGTMHLFGILSTADPNMAKQTMIVLADGLSRALVTTLFGIGFALMTSYQIGFIFNLYGEE